MDTIKWVVKTEYSIEYPMPFSIYKGTQLVEREYTNMVLGMWEDESICIGAILIAAELSLCFEIHIF